MPITVGSLSDAGDTDFQKVCSHSHNVKSEDREKLKCVLEEVKGAICMKQKMLPLRSLNGEGIS